MTEKAALFVDDEVHILNSLIRLLRGEPYRLLTALGGREGLTTLQEHPVQVVISDHRMPGMTGVEFLQSVKELYPDTIRVVLSGYADGAMIVDSVNKGEVYRFLTKPWDDDHLKTSIRQCFQQYDLLQQNNALTEHSRQKNDELRQLNEGLEQIVERRTWSLRLIRVIVDNLPVPVIGVSREGIIVVANESVRRAFPSLQKTPPGTHVRRVFPPDVVRLITRALEGTGTSPHPHTFEWDDRPVHMHIQPLREAGSVAGCILMPDTESDIGTPDDGQCRTGEPRDRPPQEKSP
ncbi:MAG TPA: response regulator [Planctomycetota bacterium]|nr:response regulator [Planctomycetota bacterium]